MNTKKVKQRSYFPEEEEKTPKIFGIYAWLSEFMAWFKIIIAITGIAAITAFIISLFLPDAAGKILIITMTGAGLIGSFIFACYIWKTKGTCNFITNSSWRYNNIRIKEED